MLMTSIALRNEEGILLFSHVIGEESKIQRRESCLAKATQRESDKSQNLALDVIENVRFGNEGTSCPVQTLSLNSPSQLEMFLE